MNRADYTWTDMTVTFGIFAAYATHHDTLCATNRLLLRTNYYYALCIVVLRVSRRIKSAH